MNQAAPRPPQVTTAFGLQLGVAGALLISSLLMTVGAFHYDGVIDQAARAIADIDPDEVSGERTGNVIGTLVFVIPAVAVGAWLAATAVGVRRGSGVARVLSLVGLGAPLVVGFLLLCCGGSFTAASFGLLSALPEDPDATFDDYSPPLYDKIESIDGGFSDVIFAVSGSLALIAVLFAISAAILLLTAPARRWFRPETPPPFPGYPPAFAYPAVTGFPAAGYPAGPAFPPAAYPSGPAFPPAGYPSGPAFPPAGSPSGPALPPAGSPSGPAFPLAGYPLIPGPPYPTFPVYSAEGAPQEPAKPQPFSTLPPALPPVTTPPSDSPPSAPAPSGTSPSAPAPSGTSPSASAPPADSAPASAPPADSPPASAPPADSPPASAPPADSPSDPPPPESPELPDQPTHSAPPSTPGP